MLRVIYCCGGYHKPQQTVILFPENEYKERKLEILVCPVCGSIAAELTQYNTKSKKYETFRPKRKQTVKFIKKLQEGKWKEEKVSFGTKSNKGFVYGVNVESQNGKIYQYAVDFNGERKLVKVI